MKDLAAMCLLDVIGLILNHVKFGAKVRSYALQFPQVQLASAIQPITRKVLRVKLLTKPDFHWNDKMHGGFGWRIQKMTGYTIRNIFC